MLTYIIILLLWFSSFNYRFFLKKFNRTIPLIFTDESFFKKPYSLKKSMFVTLITGIAVILFSVIFETIFNKKLKPNSILLMIVFLGLFVGLLLLCELFMFWESSKSTIK